MYTVSVKKLSHAVQGHTNYQRRAPVGPIKLRRGSHIWPIQPRDQQPQHQPEFPSESCTIYHNSLNPRVHVSEPRRLGGCSSPPHDWQVDSSSKHHGDPEEGALGHRPRGRQFVKGLSTRITSMSQFETLHSPQLQQGLFLCLC